MIKRKVLLDLYLKYREILYPVLVVVSSLVLIALVIFPTLLGILSDRANLEDLSSKSKTLEVKALELESMEDSSLKRNLQIALITLPQEKDLITSINSLQNQVRNQGFNILSLQIGGQLNKTTSPQGFSLKVEIQGLQIRLAELLDNIESSTPIMKVVDVSLSSPTAGGLISGAVTVEVFYSPLQSASASLDAPLPKLTEKDLELLNSFNIEVPISETGEPIGEGSFTLLPRGKENPFE